MTKKKKTIAKLVDDAAVVLQKLVRLKAADPHTGLVRCRTCGVSKHWKEMQGGHFISRKWTATKILEENIHPQCPSCNGGFGGKDKGNLIEYTLYMQDTYGRDFVEELKRLKHQTKKYCRADVEAQIAEWKSQIKELEAGIR